ncbi:MAG: hypothetical protein ACQSGP_28360 [Frankia sp.]
MAACGLVFVAVGTEIGAAVAAGVVAAAPAHADTAPHSGTPATVSADALPTVQINGVVWSQVTVGTTVYATGSFTSARPAGSPAGTNETPRANLLAYNITTGKLITSFNHVLNGQGLFVTVSPNGSRIYVGGDFTKVDGQSHQHIAAFSTADGSLVSTFKAGTNSTVDALAVTDSTVYAGGIFTAALGSNRLRLAAFAVSTGALLTWAPTADDHKVTALLMTPDRSRIIVAGKFTTINGLRAYGLGALDPVTGVLLPWAATTVVRDGGLNAGISSLRTDGHQIYGTGFVFGGGGNLEGSFAADPDSGQIHWVEDCHGDSYDTFPTGGVLYVVSHAHYCGTIGGFPQTSPETFHRATAFTTATTGIITHNPYSGYADFAGKPDPTLLDWFPTLTAGTFTGQVQAGWSVTGGGGYISIGGEFPKVNEAAQQGLVRFAVRSIAPNKVGPKYSAALTPTLVSPAARTVRVSWTTTYDVDNQALTYKVVRDGKTASPVHTVTVNSTFWSTPTVSFTDTGLTPVSTHRYRIYVYDPLKNSTVGSTRSVTVSAAH